MTNTSTEYENLGIHCGKDLVISHSIQLPQLTPMLISLTACFFLT